MPDGSKLNDSDATREAHHANEGGRARFSMPRAILAISGLVVGAVAVLMTMGPTVSPPGVIALDEAYVHGAVVDIGIADDARIAELHVDLGDTVAAGDIVATLEQAELEARVYEARAQLARLRADRDQLLLEIEVAEQTAKAEVRQAIAAVSAAEALRDAAASEVELHEGELNRARTLTKDGISTQARLEEAIDALDRSRAIHAQRDAEVREAQGRLAQARLALEGAALRQSEAAVIEKRILKAEAVLSAQESALSSTLVETKESGVVVSVGARAGSSVGTGDTIVSVWNTGHVWMNAWVPEDQVAKIEAGDRAEIRIEALGDRVFDGVVEQVLISEDGRERTLPGQPISPLLPEETRFALQVGFEPDEEAMRKLLPGMSGTVEVLVEELRDHPSGGLETLLGWAREGFGNLPGQS